MWLNTNAVLLIKPGTPGLVGVKTRIPRWLKRLALFGVAALLLVLVWGVGIEPRLIDEQHEVAFYAPGSRLVLLHGFIKKTQKTPTEDKALALKRKHAHSQAEES